MQLRHDASVMPGRLAAGHPRLLRSTKALDWPRKPGHDELGGAMLEAQQC